MESAGGLREMPPRKTLRSGQQRVVDAAIARPSGVLAVQLPTGYGKTMAAAAVFKALRAGGVVNRLLYIVPTRAQLDQFTANGHEDFADVGLSGVVPWDIGYSPGLALRKHRSNSTSVFACTIQAAATGATQVAIPEM